MPRAVTLTVVPEDTQAYEARHVHDVYDHIASHFSSTRYKPWPIIAAFLSSLPTGWVGLDSGTGNGKYLPLPSDRPPGSLWTIGLDRSRNLLTIARNAGDPPVRREVVLGDALGCCWRLAAFDYAISIATIHHLSTQERRKIAVRRLLTCVSPGHGRVLIYVWAIEQDGLSRRTVPQGADRLSGEDVFVPWVMSERSDGNGEIGIQVYDRYYHMFAQGELRQLVVEAAQDLDLFVGSSSGGVGHRRGIEIVQDGWERSNYFVELRLWEH